MPVTIAGIGAALGLANAGKSFLGGLFGNDQEMEDARQLRQNKKLQDQQIAGGKELGEFNYGLQKRMWDETNYEAQKEHMEAAGLNPALMYGMSGGGGTTTGGGAGAALPSSATAGDPNAGIANKMGLQLQQAQIATMISQANKNNAEAEAIGGVQTREGTARATAQEFQNSINKAIGLDTFKQKAEWEKELKGIEYDKENWMWDAFKATGYAGGAEDQNGIANKALKAGWEQTLQTLENSKKQGDILEATKAIEGFKAGLAKAGIAPDSPWYVKILGDLLEKVGLNPITTVKGVMK